MAREKNALKPTAAPLSLEDLDALERGLVGVVVCAGCCTEEGITAPPADAPSYVAGLHLDCPEVPTSGIGPAPGGGSYAYRERAQLSEPDTGLLLRLVAEVRASRAREAAHEADEHFERTR